MTLWDSSISNLQKNVSPPTAVFYCWDSSNEIFENKSHVYLFIIQEKIKHNVFTLIEKCEYVNSLLNRFDNVSSFRQGYFWYFGSNSI